MMASVILLYERRPEFPAGNPACAIKLSAQLSSLFFGDLPAFVGLRQAQKHLGRAAMIKIGAGFLDQRGALPHIEAFDVRARGIEGFTDFVGLPFPSKLDRRATWIDHVDFG